MKRILIANRGEIACRIIECCKKLNMHSIAVYSDADKNSKHVRLANEAIHIGPAKAKESYLSIEKILDAALKTKADAIHPGYGFLAENDLFAKKNHRLRNDLDRASTRDNNLNGQQRYCKRACLEK